MRAAAYCAEAGCTPGLRPATRNNVTALISGVAVVTTTKATSPWARWLGVALRASVVGESFYLRSFPDVPAAARRNRARPLDRRRHRRADWPRPTLASVTRGSKRWLHMRARNAGYGRRTTAGPSPSWAGCGAGMPAGARASRATCCRCRRRIAGHWHRSTAWPSTCRAERPLLVDHRVDSQHAGDLRDGRFTLARELHRRRTGDHSNRPDLREMGSERLRQAVDEVLLRWIAREVVERQDGQRADAVRAQAEEFAQAKQSAARAGRAEATAGCLAAGTGTTSR